MLFLPWKYDILNFVRLLLLQLSDLIFLRSLYQLKSAIASPRTGVVFKKRVYSMSYLCAVHNVVKFRWITFRALNSIVSRSFISKNNINNVVHLSISLSRSSKQVKWLWATRLWVVETRLKFPGAGIESSPNISLSLSLALFLSLLSSPDR